jgi:hypothetical protein
MPITQFKKLRYLKKLATGFVMTERLEFTYASQKLSKLIGYDINNNTATKTYEYTYTYTGENITSASLREISSGDTESATFTFDNSTNHFKKQNIQLLFIDPFLAADGLSFPLILSANNVTAITSTGIPVPVQIGYVTDSKQNLTMVKVNNQTTLSYSYQCQ